MKYLVVLILSFTQFIFNAQNLVPNPSFEEYYNCPLSVGGLGVNGGEPWIKYWYSMQWTPDYMHYCVGDPEASNYPTSNAWGSQEPYDGEGYISVISHDQTIGAREYIAIELIEPLEIGETYEVSFSVSDADGGELEYFDCVTNNMGLRFLKNPAYYWNNESDNNPLSPMNEADVNENDLITDSLGWTLIAGTFQANDSYTHIAIGNFFDDEHTTIVATGSGEGCAALYYIDEVCIVKQGDNCDILHNYINEYEWKQFYIPSVVNESLDLSNLPMENIEELRIVDIYGKLWLKQKTILSNLDTTFLKSGIYILQVKLKNGLFKNYKFIKE